MARKSEHQQERAAVGETFEKAVEACLRQAQQAQLVADWEHTQPLYRRIGAGRFIPVAPGRADYSGMLTGGLTFAVECKSTKEQRYYRSALPSRQAAHLDAVSAGGGLALLAIEFRGEARMQRYVIPWAGVPWAKAKSAESLSPAGLDGFSFLSPLLLEPFVQRCPRCGRAGVLNTLSCCGGC